MSSPRARPAARAAPLPGLEPRRAALDILTLVRAGATLDAALEDCRSFNALEGADRGFARALASTVLRRQGSLDAAIARHIDRPLPKRAARVVDILRLSAAQSCVLETAGHAAVTTAVELSKTFRETSGYSGLINAVTRKIAAAGPAAITSLPVRVDTPGWLWRSWERAYGPVKARAIAEAHRREAPLDLTVKSRLDALAIAERLGGTVLPTGSVRIEKAGDVTGLQGFDAGDWWVQDAAAALPARLLGDVAGKTILDLCAAPGGKTLQLAAAGASVIAVDISGHRLKRIAANLDRMRLEAQTVKADLLSWRPDELADGALLDAPCTATGTLRRNPDIAWRRQQSDLDSLARQQGLMIDRAIGFLKPGARLIYATCSLQAEEGEAQVEAAIGRNPGLIREPVAATEVAGLEFAITAKGDVRTFPSDWPELGGLDGFFMARLATGKGK